MVKSGVKGKIVFVSSILGYFSLVGYSTYSPGKHAIRGEEIYQLRNVVRLTTV